MTEQPWTAVEVRTGDGDTIPVDVVGDGPGVVVVHGGGVGARDYRRLALALSGSCRVTIYDRRRTGDADPEQIFDDLRAVLDATHAARLFGHSIGGFLVLEAARRLPLEAVAVYDPAVAVDGLFPFGFFEPFAAAVEAGDLPTAIAVTGKGLRSAGAASDLPLPVQRGIARVFLRTGIGRRMGAGLPQVVREDRMALEAAGPASRYADLKARVLLASGGRSPAYYGPICDRLAAAVPGARAVRLPRGSHNAPNIARPWFAEPFADFFGTA